MNIIFIILLSILSGYLYHLGGINHLKRPNIPLLRQKPRDVGCMLLVLGTMGIIGGFSQWWMYVLAFAGTWGGLSTYHDEMFYNWMKPRDNHWLHGMVIGCAVWSGAWLPFVLRIAILGVVMGLWSKFTPKIGDIEEARIEEFGRGFVIPLTLLLYL